MRVLILSTTSDTYLILRNEQDIKKYTDLRVKKTLFLSRLMKHKISERIIKKFSNIERLQNSSSERRVVVCGRTNG